MPFLPSVSRVHDFAVVVGAVDVGSEVAEEVAIDGGIGGAGAMRAGLDVLHAAAGCESFGSDVCPGFAVVAGDVDQTVVRAGPDEPFFDGRFADGVEGAVDLFAGHVASDGLAADALGSFGMRGEIGTDASPR